MKGKREQRLNSELQREIYDILKYKVKDNVLWITDYRGHIVDFDLDEFDVEIKMAKE